MSVSFSNACDLFSLRNGSTWSFCGYYTDMLGTLKAEWKCNIPGYTWCRYTITEFRCGAILYNSNCQNYLRKLARI